jgi:hypothetical protein
VVEKAFDEREEEGIGASARRVAALNVSPGSFFLSRRRSELTLKFDRPQMPATIIRREMPWLTR